MTQEFEVKYTPFKRIPFIHDGQIRNFNESDIQYLISTHPDKVRIEMEEREIYVGQAGSTSYPAFEEVPKLINGYVVLVRDNPLVRTIKTIQKDEDDEEDLYDAVAQYRKDHPEVPKEREQSDGWVDSLQYKIWSLAYENNSEENYKAVIEEVEKLQSKPVEGVMSAEELGDIDALAEKDVAETMKIYEGRPNHKAMVRTWLAGYKQCLEDRGSNAIAVEDVRKLYDGTIQNVGTSVKRADMPTFDQWLADYKLKNKQHH